MGLLDDAIREHLDLKRRQGADPGEIARKEREALEPVIPDEPATWGEEPSAELEADAYARQADLASVGQETMEFDMSELLGGGDYTFPDPPPVGEGTAPVRAGRIIQPEAEVSFEWQVAGHAADASEPGLPGQERLSFD
jgi:hypothetical protein